MLAVGTQLGPYRIITPLGAGGMGEVYRARDSRLDRDVAVKVLPERFADDAERLGRFEREAKAIAALSHPNILSILDFGSQDGNCFAVMELLEGETLRGSLDQSAMPWRKALEIGAAITDGLASAHAKGIVHRDLKPENLFLTSDGLVKILDFGLARREQASAPDTETATYQHPETEVGTILGTIGYMSPEQIRGQPADARSDIFSFGCVLYELLSGQRTFGRATRADVLAATLHEDPPPLSATHPDIPDDVDRLVRHCLEKKPAQRFQSARDLAFELRAILSDSAISRAKSAARVTNPGRWRVRAITGIAVVVALGLLGTVAQLLREDAPSPAVPEANLTQDNSVTLAVLPFECSEPEGTADELSEGIPDGIIKSLYTLRKLKVRPFSSVLRYKGQSADTDRLREELKVQAALRGRLVQRGVVLSISVELIDVRDDTIIWGELYSRNLNDVFALQEEITQTIARKLRIQLTGEEEKQLAKRHTDDANAFQLYVKGRHYFNKSTPQDIPRALESFEKAVAIDPDYALAYAAIAECYYWQSNIYKPPTEVIPQAKEAAARAVEIDDSLGEAHALLGLFLCLYDWDFVAGERQFQRAVELSPNSAMVRTYFGLCLANCEQFQRSLAELRLAGELDPSSFFTQLYSICPLYFMRDLDTAIAQLHTAIEVSADNFLPYAYLGLFYEQKREYPKAIAAFQKAIELGTPSEGRAQLAHIYAGAGMRAEALKILEELLELSQSKTEYVSPYNIALIYAGLGDKDRAFEWLKRASEDHSEWFSCLRVDPRLDDLRSDPRFAELLGRLKFAP